jgi:hypothetical protein
MAKEIPLTRDQFAIVDDDDYDWAMQWKWFCDCHGYAKRSLKCNKVQTTIWLHREIIGAKDGDNVDHIDGNPLNDQKNNLRICTHGENMFNKRCYSNGTSTYKGVSWKTQQEKWVAQIQCNGQKYHIGYFDTEEDAALAYNEKAKELFGDFARLNVIESKY